MEDTVKQVQAFVREFYSGLEKGKRDDLASLYVPEARVAWNGNPIPGREGVWNLLGTLPANPKYDIHVVDVQQIPHQQPNALLVAVKGNVTNNPDKARVFSQDLVLIPNPSPPQSSSSSSSAILVFSILSDNFRFVG